MIYATATEFCDVVGYRDVPRLLTPDFAATPVAAALLTARLNQADVSSWTPTDIANCDALIAIINRILASASSWMDSELCKKTQLPLSPEIYNQNIILREWCIHIALSFGNLPAQDNTKKQLANDAKDSVKKLTIIIDGHRHDTPRIFLDDDISIVNGVDVMPTNATNLLEMTAGEIIPIHYAVAIINGMVYRANPNNLAHYSNIIGIATQFNINTMKCMVQTNDISPVSGFLGGAIYVAQNGSLTSGFPVDLVFTQQIGYGIDGTRIQIDIASPIQSGAL